MYFKFSFHITISKSDCDVNFVQLTTYSLIKKISLSKEFSIRTDIESAGNSFRNDTLAIFTVFQVWALFSNNARYSELPASRRP
jgi:hypothetical protein